MATLANNANGTGFSKVYIADDADLNVAQVARRHERRRLLLRELRQGLPVGVGVEEGQGR